MTAYPSEPLHSAMVLAAGLGLRLRPLTLTRPKPLVPVAGRTILDRVLDSVAAAGVTTCVVNTHYLGTMIADHLAQRTQPRITLSPEAELLDTGGGVARARPLLGTGPFLVVNGDILWEEGAGGPALRRLGAAFDLRRMDALLLVVPRDRAVGYDGAGDFRMAGDDKAPGRLSRRGDAATAPFVFTGLQVLSPGLLDDIPAGPFSLNLLYDRAIARGRLFGLAHTGRWFHIGTPDGLELAEVGLAAPDATGAGR